MENLLAKELRIGNWIHHKYSEPNFIVSEINAFSKNNTVNGIELCDCEPIPITEQWLIDLGFIKDDNGNYWIDLQAHCLELLQSNGYWYPTYAQVPEMSHENEQRVSINRIEFVHELQNLYFALTGREFEKCKVIPKPPEPPKDRIIREDGKGLVQPRNCR